MQKSSAKKPVLPYTLKGKKVWVAGHRGMVGSAIIRRLEREDCHCLTVTRNEVNLSRQTEVEDWMAQHKPQAVFVTAAKVGGIHANNIYPAEFIYENLMIESNIIHSAYKTNVEKLLFLGSSCIYPKMAPQPITEEALLTGPLEPTNEWYAIAKIAGIKLCQAYRKQYGCDFISAMPTNLYGPGDNFDLESSHVIPALMRKAGEAARNNAESMMIWGTGSPRREFLHVDDAADAMVHMMLHYSDAPHLNVGSGEDLTILELTDMIADVVGFKGKITRDSTKPDGTPRKLMSIDKLKSLGWQPRIPLRQGLADSWQWYLSHYHGKK